MDVIIHPFPNPTAGLAGIVCMTTSFSALLVLCLGYLPVTGTFPSQRPVTWKFDVFFDPRDAGGLRGDLAHYDTTVMCQMH